MTRRYFMDDVREPPIGYAVVRTVAEMKALLASGVVDECSLDHDMGACDECVQDMRHIGDMLSPETTFFNRCPHAEDGTSLVAWIEENGCWPPVPPRVHSANPVGAARMRAAIRRHYSA